MNQPHDTLSPVQLIGLICWRGGLMLVGSYTLVRGARLFFENVDLPAQVELGLSLVIAGALLVGTSLLLERMRDMKEEQA